MKGKHEVLHEIQVLYERVRYFNKDSGHHESLFLRKSWEDVYFLFTHWIHLFWLKETIGVFFHFDTLPHANFWLAIT